MEFELDPKEPKRSRRAKILFVTFLMVFTLPLYLVRCGSDALSPLKILFKNYW